MADPQSLFDELKEAASPIRVLYDEHIDDNDELLPHVLLSNIANALLGLHMSSTPELIRFEEEDTRRFLAVLEQSFSSGDPKTQELIVVSFLEYLDGESEKQKWAQSLLGPVLSGELANLRNWKP